MAEIDVASFINVEQLLFWGLGGLLLFLFVGVIVFIVLKRGKIAFRATVMEDAGNGQYFGEKRGVLYLKEKDGSESYKLTGTKEKIPRPQSDELFPYMTEGFFGNKKYGKECFLRVVERTRNGRVFTYVKYYDTFKDKEGNIKPFLKPESINITDWAINNMIESYIKYPFTIAWEKYLPTMIIISGVVVLGFVLVAGILQ